MRLEQIAEVLRFQDRRERAYDSEIVNEGEMVYGEARPDDFDAGTGFLIPRLMERVGLFRPPGRYALRRGDILLFFNGSAERLGFCGMVVDQVVAVPARVLCIIRPYDVPAAGLFLYLREDAVRREIAGLARRDRKDNKGFVNIADIRAFEIAPLFVNAMRKAEEKTERLVAYYRDARKNLDAMIHDASMDILHAYPDD